MFERVILGIESCLKRNVGSYEHFATLVRSNPVDEVSAEIYSDKNGQCARFRAQGHGLSCFYDERLSSENTLKESTAYVSEKLRLLRQKIQNNPPMVFTHDPAITLKANGCFVDVNI